MFLCPRLSFSPFKTISFLVFFSPPFYTDTRGKEEDVRLIKIERHRRKCRDDHTNSQISSDLDKDTHNTDIDIQKG